MNKVQTHKITQSQERYLLGETPHANFRVISFIKLQNDA